MGRYVTGYTLGNVADIYRDFDTTIKLARQAKQPATVALLQNALRLYMNDLERAGQRGAQAAERGMKERLQATQRRPDSGVGRHLRDHVRARPVRAPLPSGQVGVADKDQLERVTDDNGFAYWIVQEKGSRANIGRTIRGFFYDAGYSGPTRPAPGYTGTRGAQPLFEPGSTMPGPRGGRGGKGVIRNPIPARHFVRDGAKQGGQVWLADMGYAEKNARRNIRDAFGGGGGRRRRGRP